jgi:UDP-N-acetylmuramoyl-L-alanyl-D-glutamate--2,6-diaminopimelate ligase
MGDIASDIADFTVVTSDNPRSENPDTIIQEILEGIQNNNMASVRVNPDRREAIREAINMASSGDIVVIAGKGHEDYQILADRTIHFDDREVAREILREMRS